MATTPRGAEDTVLEWDAFIGPGADEKRTALAVRDGDHWQDTSYARLRRHAVGVSSHLIAAGLTHGDRVAILSASRPEWAVAFFAIIRGGGVVVPLDVKLTVPELAAQLSDASPRVLFASAVLVETARQVKSRVGGLEQVIVMGGEDAAGAFVPMAALTETAPSPARRRVADETAVITYTSGTTGTPKGVMTTFGNLLFEVEASRRIFELTSRDVYLSMLPLNHLFELTGGLLVPLTTGAQVCYVDTLYPEEIMRSIRERGATRMLTVPLFLTLLKAGIERQVQHAGRVRPVVFAVMLAAARWIPWVSLRKALFHTVHRQLGGGTLGEFCSGGAPLEPSVEDFFPRLGFAVYQGYGLTETSPAVTVNTPGHRRLGSVGRALPGVAIRLINDDPNRGEGEILTRGPHVMKGYYKRDDLTREVIDQDGWLHTGDLGRLDEDLFLYVTGRIKNVIVLGGGKNVIPEEVEAALARSPRLKEVCVVGRPSTDGLAAGHEQVLAVVVPEEALASRLLESPEALHEEMEDEVERLVHDLAPYKRPSNVVVSLEELPKTSTRKVKRLLVHEWLDQRQETAS